MSRGPSLILRREPKGAKSESDRGLGAALRQQFRELVKVLTRSGPEPKLRPRRQRRREEAGRSFRTAARNMLRRVVRLPAIASAAELLWDTLDWLNPWHHHDAAGTNEIDEGLHYTEHDHLSPRP
jgi:hypothetical protein